MAHLLSKDGMSKRNRIGAWATVVGIAFCSWQFSTEVNQPLMPANPIDTGDSLEPEPPSNATGDAKADDHVNLWLAGGGSIDWDDATSFDFEAARREAEGLSLHNDGEHLPRTVIPMTARLIYRKGYGESATSNGVHFIETGEDLTFDEVPRSSPSDNPQTPRRQLERLRSTHPSLYDSAPEVRNLLGN